jgi:hypothetical protein
MKLEYGKGHFFIKMKKDHMQLVGSTYLSQIVAKPIILNICSEIFLLRGWQLQNNMSSTSLHWFPI